MSEGLVEVSAMVNHVYQLENCEYIGLKEQLQELNVVLKKKSNIRGCSMPKAGESLKNGKFLPKLEESVTTQGKQTSTLYTETYICGHLHSQRKKRQRTEGSDGPVPHCGFTARAVISKLNPEICTLTYPAEHACNAANDQHERRRSGVPTASILPEKVKDILKKLVSEKKTASPAFQMKNSQGISDPNCKGF